MTYKVDKEKLFPKAVWMPEKAAKIIRAREIEASKTIAVENIRASSNSWRDEIAEFADAVINGTAIKYGSSMDALNTMHLVFRIYCADEEWRARYELTDTIPEYE